MTTLQIGTVFWPRSFQCLTVWWTEVTSPDENACGRTNKVFIYLFVLQEGLAPFRAGWHVFSGYDLEEPEQSEFGSDTAEISELEGEGVRTSTPSIMRRAVRSAAVTRSASHDVPLSASSRIHDRSLICLTVNSTTYRSKDIVKNGTKKFTMNFSLRLPTGFPSKVTVENYKLKFT